MVVVSVRVAIQADFRNASFDVRLAEFLILRTAPDLSEVVCVAEVGDFRIADFAAWNDAHVR